MLERRRDVHEPVRHEPVGRRPASTRCSTSARTSARAARGWPGTGRVATATESNSARWSRLTSGCTQYTTSGRRSRTCSSTTPLTLDVRDRVEPHVGKVEVDVVASRRAPRPPRRRPRPPSARARSASPGYCVDEPSVTQRMRTSSPRRSAWRAIVPPIPSTSSSGCAAIDQHATHPSTAPTGSRDRSRAVRPRRPSRPPPRAARRRRSARRRRRRRWATTVPTGAAASSSTAAAPATARPSRRRGT